MHSRIYFGIVEDRDDRSQLGRCKVRVAGLHTHDKKMLPTDDLPWAIVMQPVGGGISVCPKEGTEVIVMFADEPDCQIPVIMGTVNTLPQQTSVWVDQIPGSPRIRDVTDPEIGHELARNANEDANNKSEQIRVNGPTETDKANGAAIVNNASDSTSGSIKVIADGNTNPAAQGRSTVAARMSNTYGNGNQSVTEQIVAQQVATGSANAVVTEYANRLSSIVGSDVASRIARGETSLSAEIGKLQSSIAIATAQLGQSIVDNAVSTLLQTNTAKQLNALASATGGIAQSFGSLSSAFNQGLSFDALSTGFNAIGGVVKGVSSLGSAIGSLTTSSTGLNGVSQTINEKSATEAVGSAAQSVINQGTQLATNITSQVSNVLTTQYNQSVAAFNEVSSMIGQLTDSGFDPAKLGEIADGLTGPGGSKLQGAVTDAVTTQLRQCLAYGTKPLEIIDGVMETVEMYIPKAQAVLETAAVAVMRENWDPSYITEPIRAVVASIRSSLAKGISYVISGGSNFTKYVTDLITKYGSVIFDVFGIGSAIVNQALSIIPFGSIISSTISSLISSILPGGNSANEIGVTPGVVTNVINSGSYSSNAFSQSGNRHNIDRVGASRVTGAMVAGVGEGNTASVHGRNGGPNFGGGVQVESVPGPISVQTNPSTTNRPVNATLPDIPLSIYGITDENKVEANIKTIASRITSKLTTLETQSAFLALTYAYTHCTPVIHDYEYRSISDLESRFPRTFVGADDDTLTQYLFARSLNKKTAEQFYNFVYDSANDGQRLGNVNADDGYRFAESGLLPIVGRNGYTSRNATDASTIVSDLNLAIDVAITDFLNAIKNAPAGSIAIFNQALTVYPEINAVVAKQAFEHFYGAKLFTSYKTTEKIAGTQYDRNSYYGSAQETPVTYGYQDPNGKYPYVRDVMKSTVDQLARGDVTNSIVARREANRKTSVPIANSRNTWDEPHSQYRAVYPYNNVQSTESGHVIELDDTPGAERIHIYHRAGTFTEISYNGTKTTRIVGDNYEIIDRNGFISVSGNANITANGNINIRCLSDVNIESDGTIDVQSHGSLNLSAANDVNISAGNNVNVWANKGANFQSNDHIHVRSANGSIFETAKEDISVYAGQNSYTTGRQNVYINGGTNVAIEAETGTVDILGEQTTSVTSTSGSLQLYGGANTALSGGRNVDIHGGLGIHMQCLANFTLLSTGFCRIQSSAIDVTSLSYIHADATSDISLGAVGAIIASANIGVEVGATGAININAGGVLTMGAKGAASLQAGGVVGIDGTVVGLNSGMSLPCAPVLALPALISGPATKATVAQGAPLGEKAVLYGMVTLAPRNGAYPNIPVLSIEPPIVDREQIIEDYDELNTPDGLLISKNLQVQNGLPNMIKGPTVNPSFNVTHEHIDNPLVPQLVNDLVYNANTKVSEHFNLGDFFDRGFNKVHVLQDQAGLTKADIVANIANVAENVVEKIVSLLPGGIDGYRKQWFINSGYRTTNNNATSGGSSTSQHCKGQAVDIQLAGGSKSEHFELIQKIASSVAFDQLILEYSPNGRTAWIHCSYNVGHNRFDCKTINLASTGRAESGFVLYA